VRHEYKDHYSRFSDAQAYDRVCAEKLVFHLLFLFFRSQLRFDIPIQENAPNKKVYSITAAGKQKFHSLLKDPVQLERTKDDFLSRLFFFAHLEREDRLELAGNYMKSIVAEKEQLEAARPEIEDLADPFQKECFLFGVRMIDALSKNVAKTLEALKMFS